MKNLENIEIHKRMRRGCFLELEQRIAIIFLNVKNRSYVLKKMILVMVIFFFLQACKTREDYSTSLKIAYENVAKATFRYPFDESHWQDEHLKYDELLAEAPEDIRNHFFLSIILMCRISSREIGKFSFLVRDKFPPESLRDYLVEYRNSEKIYCLTKEQLEEVDCWIQFLSNFAQYYKAKGKS